ncbi:MAG: outer membrane beta-barrel family protein [Bacteroidota bacterium]
MRSFFLLGMMVLLASAQLTAQSNYQVSGNMIDGNDQEVAFANVLLLRASDSTLVKGAISSETGTFSFSDVAADRYFIEGSLVGFQTAQSEVFDLRSNFTVPTLILLEGESLDEVVVVAEKPLYTQKVDRMVINVEGSIVSSGGTALEVLERSPGVVVNRQNNALSLVGKDGVVVMINDKISYVPASAIVQMLDGMSADNIESIELITTPPANFDAEGNAGFINIVLKKNADLGLNGSYSLSAGWGRGVVTNDNINFNYRKEKLNVFGSYSFRLDERFNPIKTSREFMQDGVLLATESETDRFPQQRNHNVRLGLDYQISDKTISGFIVNAFDNRWTMDAFNRSFDSSDGMPTGFVALDNQEKNQLQHFGANYNIAHNFTDDRKLSLDVDYLFYQFDNPTDYSNSFFDGDGNFLNDAMLRSRKDTPLTTWVGKVDYTDKVTEKIKLEMGGKVIKNDFENDVSVENLIDGVWVFDPTLTNFSVLDEFIWAGYGSLDATLSEKTSVKAGLRYEYTDSKLDVNTQGTVVDRQFGVWFPSVFVNRQWTEQFSTNVSYSKRITRPTFNDLAPFVIFFEPNTFISGNASLQPAISNSYKIDLNYKSYFLSLQYTDQDMSIANFQERIDPETGRLIFEAANLDYTRTFAIIAGIPVKLTSWWRTQNNVNYVRQKVRSFYLGEPIEQELGIFNANSTWSFKISDKWSSELSGFYNGAGFFGNAVYEAVWGVNFGLQHEFSEKWGTVKFAISDLFDSIVFNGGTDLPEQNIRTSNTFDFSQRTFTLTYTRNFGNSKLRSARNRETGSEEERRRVN